MSNVCSPVSTLKVNPEVSGLENLTGTARIFVGMLIGSGGTVPGMTGPVGAPFK